MYFLGDAIHLKMVQKKTVCGCVSMCGETGWRRGKNKNGKAKVVKSQHYVNPDKGYTLELFILFSSVELFNLKLFINRSTFVKKYLLTMRKYDNRLESFLIKI